jgi:heme-degrading monooxygenase HmoA
MHVRIASFEGARPEQAETARRLAREQFLPQMQQMAGYAGYGMLARIGGGEALGLAFFDSEEALENADHTLDSMSPPDELSGIRRTSVDRYEVAINDVSDTAVVARVTRLKGSPDRIDEGIRHARETILPRARELDGWRGVLFLVDRGTGDGIIVTFWESEAALRASEEAANKLRQETAEAGGETIVDVDRYEVVLVELPVHAGIS